MFKVGDKVLLDGKNLKTIQPKAKLSDKRHGPFEITDVLNPVTYCLKLLPKWHIHPVFHASLLVPYIKTPAHGLNFLGVPPDLLDTDKEYNMEEILDLRPTCNKQGMEYLVKWLDYSSSENMWEPVLGLTKVLNNITNFYKAYKKPLPRLQGLDVSIGDIWAGTSALQAQAQPKEGVLSRIASILLPPPWSTSSLC